MLSRLQGTILTIHPAIFWPKNERTSKATQNRGPTQFCNLAAVLHVVQCLAPVKTLHLAESNAKHKVQNTSTASHSAASAAQATVESCHTIAPRQV